MIARVIAPLVLVLMMVVPNSSPASARLAGRDGPTAVSVPDFNGDGFADLAIGVPQDRVNGQPSGAVSVLYGGAGGLQANAPDDQLWTQDSPGVKGDAMPSEWLGAATAPNDFNGDGYADLAIGIPYEGLGTGTGGGAVAVLFGSPAGLQADAPDDQLWTQDSPGVRDKAEGEDEFGSALAAADFNGDGYGDLAVGIPWEDTRDCCYDGNGAVQVLYGSSFGLQATSPDDQVWAQDTPGIPDQAEYLDHYGGSLITADYNGDGFEDLAVGVGCENLSHINAGASNVLYGSSHGLQTVQYPSQLWSEDSRGVKGTGADSGSFGWAGSSGDFNQDGFPDLAVGDLAQTVHGVISAGSVSVLYGSTRGVQALSPDDQLLSQDSPGVDDQAEDADFFGETLVAGDFNADGFLDLAAAAPWESLQGPPSVSIAGSVNVLYGSAFGLQTMAPADQFWDQDSPDVQDQAEEGDFFGSALTSADFNGDGFVDLALGISREDVNAVNSAGEVQVLYGSAGGLQASSPDDQLWTQDSPGVQGELDADDDFGWSLHSSDSRFDCGE